MSADLVLALRWKGYTVGDEAPPYNAVVQDGLIAQWDHPTDPQPDEATIIAEWQAAEDGEEADKRSRLEAQIRAQVPEPTYREAELSEAVRRNLVQLDSAANARSTELDSTPAEDLDTFDPTLEPVEYAVSSHCTLALEIARLDEWAGDPGKTVGFRAILTVQEDFEDDGSTARFIPTEIPTDEAGGPLGPFVQQPAPNDKQWILESRDGYKWTDTMEWVRGYLYWDNGTRQVTPVISARGLMGVDPADQVKLGQATVNYAQIAAARFFRRRGTQMKPEDKGLGVRTARNGT